MSTYEAPATCGIVSLQRHGDVTDPEMTPVRTVRAGGQHRLAMVMPYNAGMTPRDVAAEPTSTLTTRDRLALIIPAGGSWQDQATPTFEPVPTQTARESKGLAWTDAPATTWRWCSRSQATPSSARQATGRGTSS
jgi:hypothetical protein